jgi:hypothetical protein
MHNLRQPLMGGRFVGGHNGALFGTVTSATTHCLDVVISFKNAGADSEFS